jgi:hypothetical protein
MKYILSVLLALVSIQSYGAIIFRGDFESGTIVKPAANKPDSFWQNVMGPGCTLTNDANARGTYNAANDIHLVTSPKRAGDYAVSILTRRLCDYRTLNGEGEQKGRQEILVQEQSFKQYLNTEYWVGFSFYIPTSYNIETNDQAITSIFQQKQLASDNPTGFSTTCCQYDFSIEGDQIHFEIENMYTTGSTVNSRTLQSEAARSYDWTLTKGVWTDVQLHYRMCSIELLATGCQPLYELWVNVNGAQSATPVKTWTSGANTAAGKKDGVVGPVYLAGPKASVYKYAYNCTIAGPNYSGYPPNSAQKDFAFCTTQINGNSRNPTNNLTSVNVFFDEILIGDASSSLAEIAPHVFGGGGGSSDFVGTFETGQIQTSGTTPDGFLVQTFNGSTYVGVTDGGAGPASGYDTRVVGSEVVGGVTVNPRKGSYFARSEISYSKNYTTYNGNSGADKPRSNITMSKDALRTAFDDENWLGFSIFLPSNFVHDTGDKNGDQGNQLFTNYASETTRTQFTMLEYVPTGETESHWIFQYFTDATSITENPAKRTTVDLGPVTGDLGKWTDFVIRYRMNPFTTATNASTITGGKNQIYQGNRGILQVWKASGAVDGNGDRTMTKVVDIENAPVGLVPPAATTPDTDKMINAVRLYKYFWKTNTTANTGTIWAGFDEIKAGRAADGATYSSVYAGGSAPEEVAVIGMNLGNPVPPNTPATINDRSITFTTDGGDTSGVSRISVTAGGITEDMPAIASNATGGHFYTGPFTGITDPNATFTFYYDNTMQLNTEGAQPFSGWDNDGVVSPVASYNLDGFLDFGATAGVTIANNEIGFNQLEYGDGVTKINVTSGDTIKIRGVLDAGTTGKARLRAKSRVGGVSLYNIVSGTLGSLSATTPTHGTNHVFTEVTRNGLHFFEWAYAASQTGIFEFSIGPDGEAIGDSVVALEAKVWVNQQYATPLTFNRTLALTDVTPPDIYNCTFGSPSSGNLQYTCNLSEIGGSVKLMVTSSATVPSKADIAACTGALACRTLPATELVVSGTETGINPYVDKHLYAYQIDGAGLESAVKPADDYVPAEDTVIKRIKFLSNTARLRTITGAEYTGPLDFFLLTNSDPRLPGTKNDLVYIDNPSISNGVINFTETNVQCATCTGSINALAPGEYWYSTRSEDGSVKSVYTINVVAE